MGNQRISRWLEMDEKQIVVWRDSGSFYERNQKDIRASDKLFCS